MQRKATKPPSPPNQSIALLKTVMKRFSLVLLLLMTLVIILLGEIDSRLTEIARMKMVDKLLPVMTFMSWPIEYVINIGDHVNELFTLQAENNILRKENKALRRYYDLSRHIQTENEELRKLLQVVREPKATFITARVIGDTSGPYVRSALINAGQLQGVKKGQIVINEQGVVGRIIETAEHSARILLLTDLNSKIPAITADSRERSIAAGDNSDAIKILYLAEDSKVHAGEQVFTSGDGGMFPSGLLLGTIYTANDKSLYINPSVSWNRLGFVQVVSY